MHHYFLALGLAIPLSTGVVAAAEAHDHDDHAGQPHAEPAEHDEHAGHSDGAHGKEAAATAMGPANIGATTLSVSRHGPITAGQEAVIALAVTTGPKPSELRCWVGVKNGRGSVKARLEGDEHGHFHGHLEVPAVLPNDAALWLEQIDDQGERLRTSLALTASTDDSPHKH
ncbi:MAG: hypothetical protein PF961_17315 [Planctomycetota bacterium]|jgi:hypothetical protein|nr:hypothetical protein [Planctomycetota bacterium]